MNAQIAKSPKNSGFYDLLAQLQMQNKNLDQAAATAQKAMQMNPDDGEAVAILRAAPGAARTDGQCYRRLGAMVKGASRRCQRPCYSRNPRGIARRDGARPRILQESLANPAAQPIAANNLAYRMLANGGNVDVALTLAQTARQACQIHPAPQTPWRGPTTTREPTDLPAIFLEDAIKDRSEQRHNAVSPGDGVQQARRQEQRGDSL